MPASGEAAVNSSRIRFTVFRLQSGRPAIFIGRPRTEMLKANAAAVDALTAPELTGIEAGCSRRAPTHGGVAALSYLDAVWNRQTQDDVPDRHKPPPLLNIVTQMQ
jgi:hypothetical protein